MSKQTQDLVNQLELRVEELTQANRRLQQQAAQLEANGQIYQLLTLAFADVESLNKQVVAIIKSAFALEHVSIFLIDSSGQWAVLNQAAGKGSRKFKSQQYKLPVDNGSVTGWVGQNQKPYLSYPAEFVEMDDRAFSIKSEFSKAPSIMALPLVANQKLIGVLNLHHPAEQAFDRQDFDFFQNLAGQLAQAIANIDQATDAASQNNQMELIKEFAVSINARLDIESIMMATVNLAPRLGATFGEVHLLSDADEAYYKSSNPQRNSMAAAKQQMLARRALSEGLEFELLARQQPLVLNDIQSIEQGHAWKNEAASRALVCAPITVEEGRLVGTISFIASEPGHFSAADLTLLDIIAAQVMAALTGALRLGDIQSDLHETHVMLDISRNLSGSTTPREVYEAIIQSVTSLGADSCTLYLCDELDSNNLPTYGQIVFAGNTKSSKKLQAIQQRFPLSKYEVLDDLVYTQETLVFENIEADERLSVKEQEFFRQFRAKSLVINPLVIRGHVIGLLSIEYQNHHHFSERELALYRTVCNQTTIALEHARQRKRTEEALAETQTLYRAGRVLAGADDLQEILQEALIEFVYSFGLDQGGVTLLTPDGKFGQLRAYLERGQLQNIEKLRFPIRDGIVYQQLLLSGQPFTCYDVASDIRMGEFQSFNEDKSIKSTLQAPIIIRGETVGWIGVDAVDKHREFSQKDIDLARAMADQIAIAIQNHRLLEQTERRAEQLKAVASVGEAITGLLELDEVLRLTVNLIRDRFGFYHVSIFLLDERREWAVVKASTGEVGKIMVERPHKLGVGSNSIVGYVTANATPRIALDVGEDAVHFKNPLLPHTRSEMALPLISRGAVIGALDVQSVEPNAFTGDDIETLQVMANQTSTAIENARLFEQTQRRLTEQAMLYSIGTKVGGTLKLQETTDILVAETAQALNVAECVLTLLEENNVAYVISDYIKKGAGFSSHQGQRFDIDHFVSWSTISTSKQEFVYHLGDASGRQGWEFTYLNEHRGTAMAIVPVLLRNEVIGLLEIYDDKPGRQFSQEDISLLDSIALQAANAIENARLFAQTQRTLERTQTLHQISRALATGQKEHLTFEAVLDEYLNLLGLTQGALMLFDKAANTNIAQARLIDGKPVEPNLLIPYQDDRVFQHLQKESLPLVIDNVAGHPLTEDYILTREQGNITAILCIPLVMRQETIGTIIVEATTPGYMFNQGDIEIGESIADQLMIWLENRRLLAEAQRRSELLQTAAEVSRAASSILDIDHLINTSVNLIRDQFDFYYVGLFLVDEAKEWAVLRAGTGDAGRIQLERNHRLKIGGESMIGWSIANRKARIALDVGQEAVHFRNPILPDTHSEMALPLISRDEAIGALTVQSTERAAFSDEDITLLQTMADHLANAIENANLFSQTQEALSEAESLYQITQELASARDEETVFQLAMNAVSTLGVESIAIYLYSGNELENTPPSEQFIEQKAVWVATGTPAVPNGTRLQVANFIDEQIVPRYGYYLIENIDDNQDLSEAMRAMLIQIGITTLLVLPLSTHQRRLGYLLAAYKSTGRTFTQKQRRFCTTLAQQVVTALENLRLLDASQRRARREEIIREISLKIRNAVDVDEILKTTVTELGKVLGTSRGNITLGVAAPPTPTAEKQASNGSQGNGKSSQPVGNKESNNHGE